MTLKRVKIVSTMEVQKRHERIDNFWGVSAVLFSAFSFVLWSLVLLKMELARILFKEILSTVKNPIPI